MNLARRRQIPLSIAGGNLYLRRYEFGDDADLYRAARESIEEVYPYLLWCHPGYSLADARTWLKTVKSEWDKGNSYGFVIRDAETDAFLGGCGLNRVDENPMMNLGYWVRTGAAGRGIATQAAQTLARFGFDCLGLQRIEIIMSIENHASRRVAEKAGARFEGVMANRLFLHGRAHDARLYALTP